MRSIRCSARSPRCGRSAPRRFWCRSWSGPSRWSCSRSAPRISPTMPARSPFRAARSIAATRARSPPPCGKPRRRSDSIARFIHPIGYLDLYMTTLGYRIVPTLARIEPDFELTLNRCGSRRYVRGAARVSDGAGQSPAAQPGMERPDAHLLCHSVRSALHLGRDRGYPAEPIRPDLSRMIRQVLTELLLFLSPFIAYAIFLSATRAGVLKPESWPLRIVTLLTAVALVLVARQLRHVDFRCAARLDLCARPYGRRPVGAGDEQVTGSANSGRTDRTLAEAEWLRAGALGARARHIGSRRRGGAGGRRRRAQFAARTCRRATSSMWRRRRCRARSSAAPKPRGSRQCPPDSSMAP